MQKENLTFQGKLKLILQGMTHHWNLRLLGKAMNPSADEQPTSCYWAYDIALW